MAPYFNILGRESNLNLDTHACEVIETLNLTLIIHYGLLEQEIEKSKRP
ncbi:MAG: hypothetical protein M3N41_00890 [Acidobacteriota bacterium]|nr:hypothetical protein [Acidobacteriota bacterium]